MTKKKPPPKDKKRKVLKKPSKYTSVTLGGKKVTFEKGALRKKLGIKEGQRIPRSLLFRLDKAKIGDVVEGHKVTRLMKQRVNLALVLMKSK